MASGAGETDWKEWKAASFHRTWLAKGRVLVDYPAIFTAV